MSVQTCPLIFRLHIISLLSFSSEKQCNMWRQSSLFYVFMCRRHPLFFHFCRFLSSEKIFNMCRYFPCFFPDFKTYLVVGQLYFSSLFHRHFFFFFCVAQIWRIGTEYLGGQSAFSYWVINWRYNVYTFILLITPRKDTHRWKNKVISLIQHLH